MYIHAFQRSVLPPDGCGTVPEQYPETYKPYILALSPQQGSDFAMLAYHLT